LCWSCLNFVLVTFTSCFFFIFCDAGPISIESTDKDATSGFQTHEKKNRYKRAAKSNLTPPKMKKIKVSQDAGDMYNKFVCHGRKFKRQPKNYAVLVFSNFLPSLFI
jgi:hypothetical protein